MTNPPERPRPGAGRPEAGVERPKPGVNSSQHLVSERGDNQLHGDKVDEITHFLDLTTKNESLLHQTLPFLDELIHELDRDSKD